MYELRISFGSNTKALQLGNTSHFGPAVVIQWLCHMNHLTSVVGVVGATVLANC
jgi:hypothetical protein